MKSFKFINPIKEYICPFCYEYFTLNQVKFRITHESAAPIHDPKLSQYYGKPTLAGPVIERKKDRFAPVRDRVVLPRKIKDPNSGLFADEWACPHCHNPLPTYFPDVDSHIISVVGAPASGKTNFITVLLNEIQKNGFHLGLSRHAQDVGVVDDQKTTNKYNKYYNKLYQKGEDLGKTDTRESDHYPLIYELRSNVSRAGKKKNLFLVFYDSAGEVFSDMSKMQRQARYLGNSSGIIYLLDSFQIPDVAKGLISLGVPIPKVAGNFHMVLDQIRQVLEKQGKLKLNKPSQLPVAFTFSKMDALMEDHLVPPDFTLREPSYHEQYRVYNPEEVKIVSDEVKSLLIRWDQEALIESVKSMFAHHAYFSISALGSTPKLGKIDEVKPHRVLDPLLYILDQLNFSLPKSNQPL